MSGQQSNFVSRGAQPGQHQVVGRRHRHHRHGGDRRLPHLLRLRRVPGNDDQHRRRGRLAADERRRRQPRHQERHRTLQGLGRFYDTNDRFESNNITDEQRKQGATSGNPIQDVKDFGIEAGGPIKKGRAWIWGSYGKSEHQRRRARLLQADCRVPGATRRPSVALAADIKDVNDCLNSDTTLLVNTNLKGEDSALQRATSSSLFNSMSKKERNARGADDLHPIETTSRQAAVTSSFGTNYWITRPVAHLQVRRSVGRVSDRLAARPRSTRTSATTSSSTSTRTELRDVQPALIVASGLNLPLGVAERVPASREQPDVERRTTSCPARSAATTRSSSAATGATRTASRSATPAGSRRSRFPNQAAYDNNTCTSLATGCAAALTRDSHSIYRLTNISAFVQDTITRKQMTLSLGLRYDQNHDQALAATIPAQRHHAGAAARGQLRRCGSEASSSTTSRRASASPTTSRVTAARSRARTSRATTGRWAPARSPARSTRCRASRSATRGRTSTATARSRPTRSFPHERQLRELPGALRQLGSGEPVVANDGEHDRHEPEERHDRRVHRRRQPRDRQRASRSDLNYIWRRYDNFNQSFTNGITSADYIATHVHVPTCTVAGARCETVTPTYPSFQPGDDLDAEEHAELQPYVQRRRDHRRASGWRTAG